MALAIIFLLDTSGFFLNKYITKEQDGLAVLINISGRQRMLSQRITLLLHEKIATERNDGDTEAINKDLKEKLTLFETSHDILKNEAQKRDPENKVLRPHYFGEGGLNGQVESFIKNSRELMVSRDDSILKRHSIFAKGPLLYELNKAVKLFELQSSTLTDAMKVVELFLYLINTLALIFIYFFILKPLQKEILKREDELQQARKIAEEESHFKSMFLANMSHELRTPLNGVLGTADLMGSTQLNQEQQDYLDIINQSGKILLGVINNILDLTKLQMGQVELEKVTFSPKELLEGIPKSFRYPLESRGLSFNLQLDDLPAALEGDTTRLSQILNNIIGNAVKFTEEGGITLKASYQDNQLSIDIEDTGIGMSEMALSRIFEDFAQADSSTTKKFGGTGLGLSITKELITLMGGTITVQSQEGKGTTFSLNIPLPLGNPNRLPRKSSPVYADKSIDGQNKKVLVVDDNDINRKLMVRILERYNLIPIEVDSGHACLDFLNENQVDLILMDYHMPGLNGIETALEARKRFTNMPPIIALTADVMEETNKKILEAGMKELIPKPIQRDDLQRILATYLQIELS